MIKDKKWKLLLLMILATVSLAACASTPIIDSRGGSGNIPHDAQRVHDDMYTCKSIAEDNTNIAWETSKKIYNISRAQFLWLPPKAEDRYKKIYEACLTGRGHMVLEWE